jgi:steroid 5-alpha reductase family enzyme
MKSSKKIGLLIIGLTYLLSFGLQASLYFLFIQSNPIWLSILLVDVIATFFVYLVGTIFQNATVYDPYWSVEPMFVSLFLVILNKNFSLGSLLTLAIIWIWGLRLTINWIITFKNLTHQDWRYDELKKKSDKLYFAVNFLGIHLTPTLIVYLAMLPFIYLITNNLAFNPLALIGAFVSIFGIYLEIHSDIAMHHFQKIRQSKGEIINVGLWKHSRHPNYLGEILFWWGLFFIAVALAPSLYWTGVGAIANNLMFVFISVPMAENHMATYKNDFATYKKQTRMLLPIPRKG